MKKRTGLLWSEALIFEKVSPGGLKRYLLFFLAVLLALTWRYRFLGDDCFISFRYARHLVDSLGLCFNAGERVEGYTNFLWVLIMAGGMKLGIKPEWFSTILGAMAGVVLIVLVFRMGLQMFGHVRIILLAPAFLCLSRTYASWMTGGLETRFFSLLIFAANMALLHELGIIGRTSAPAKGWLSGLLFGLASLTRPEGYLFMGLGLGLVALFRAFRPLRQDFILLAVFLLCTVPHLAWKYAYYGDLLPNSFYAKVPGVWLSQGTWYLLGFFFYYSLWLLIPLVLGNLAFLVRQKGAIQWREKRFVGSVYFFAVFLAYTTYIWMIGGDRQEYRLLDPILPFIYLSIQGGIIGLNKLLNTRRFPEFKNSILMQLLILVIILAPLMTAIPLVAGFRPYKGIKNVENLSEYAQWRRWEGRVLSEFIQPEETIATKGAGALAYYNSNIYVLDMHGLNDRVVAHQPVKKRGIIGHEKIASRDYICSNGITFIMPDLYPKPPDPAKRTKIADKGGFCVKLKSDAFLLSATALSSKQIQERFEGHEIVILPTDSWCYQGER